MSLLSCCRCWTLKTCCMLPAQHQTADYLINKGEHLSDKVSYFLLKLVETKLKGKRTLGAFRPKVPGTFSSRVFSSRNLKVPAACCCLCVYCDIKLWEDCAYQASNVRKSNIADMLLSSHIPSQSGLPLAQQGLHLVLGRFVVISFHLLWSSISTCISTAILPGVQHP